jgi:hypothetical protein
MTTSGVTGDEATMLVDAHVHVHPCFDLALFLGSAATNMERASRELDLDDAPKLLLLTESAGEDYFGEFARGGNGAHGAWSFRRVEEISVAALEGGEPRLVVVAGRQVVTREGLEVLALACAGEFPDGAPIAATLESVIERGGLAVVPWGFGKWWRRRGRLLAGLLADQRPELFFLGDNGGRPRLGPRPALFAHAGELGIRVLPGSDPLPFPDHARRPGSFGFALDGLFDAERPAESLKRGLRRVENRPRPFGRCQASLPFLRNQLAMQWLKRTGRPS